MPRSTHSCLALIALLALASAPNAHAHDAFDWINKGGYRNQQGEHCCGRDDCYEVSPNRVEQNAEGYSLPDHNMTVPGRQALPSEDGRYWVCKVGTRLRCFFAPLNPS